MVMHYLFITVGETVARLGVAKLVDKLGGKDTIEKLREERIAAEKTSARAQINAFSLMNEAKQAGTQTTASVVDGTAPCPSCVCYEETSLAQSYSQLIVQHCGDAEAIPQGYGGTVLQVREHLTKAADAARRLKEKPLFAQAGAIFAQGLDGLRVSIEGEGITCSQIKNILPSIQEAVNVADRIAARWWEKPLDAPTAQPHPG